MELWAPYKWPYTVVGKKGKHYSPKWWWKMVMNPMVESKKSHHQPNKHKLCGNFPGSFWSFVGVFCCHPSEEYAQGKLEEISPVFGVKIPQKIVETTTQLLFRLFVGRYFWGILGLAGFFPFSALLFGVRASCHESGIFSFEWYLYYPDAPCMVYLPTFGWLSLW